MKRKITFLSAAFMLLAFLAIPLGMRGQTTVASFVRNGNSNETNGGEFTTTFSAKSGYYQDANGDCYMQILNTDAYWTTTPASISFAAKIGGGSGNKDLSNPVYVALLDENGDVINETQREVTSHITTNTGDDYSISIPVTNNVYGVKLSHVKETGYNVRYYSFSLSFSAEGGDTPSTPTTYTVTYDCNGGTSNCPENVTDIEAGTTINLAEAPSKTDYDFAGWSDGSNIFDADDEYTVNSDVTFTAQWTENTTPSGSEVVDVLNWAATGSPTNYTDWTYTAPSGAAYAGQSSGTYQSIQLRSNNNNSGIVTTTSAGKVTKISVNWNSNTASGRTLNVYGKNSAYSNATDLYGNNAGTLIGTIVYGTSTELNITDDYEFIGMRSASAAMYLNEVDITWASSTPAAVATPTFDPASGQEFGNDGLQVTIACTTSGASIYYTLDGSTPDNQSTPYEGAILLTETTTIKAIAYVGTDNSSVATATYTYVDPDAAGTMNNPYTVAQAIAAIDAGVGTQGVYATGIVSQIVTAYDQGYQNVTFDIVDAVGDQVYLRAYRCGGDEAANVAAGDIVLVYGNLTKYGEIYEFGQGCQVVSLTHPAVAVEAPTFNPVAGVYEEAQNVTISCATEGATIRYTLDGTEPTSESYEYVEPLNIASTTTIKAIAIKDNDVSTVSTATYTIVQLNNISDITEVGTAYMVKGTVVATNSRGFIMGDGTGYVYYYKGSAVNQSIGDMVKVSGTTGTYGQIIQFTNTATVTEATTSNYDGTPAADFITEVPDYSQEYHLSDYLEYEGTLDKDGSNYLVTLGENQIQISYPTTEQVEALNALNGKTVHVKGYFSGINSSSRFTTMLESIEEVTNPSITINPANYDVTAEGGEGTIMVTYDGVGDTYPQVAFYDENGEPVDYAEYYESWITVNVNYEDNDNVYYNCDANTGEARTVYFKVYVDNVYSNMVTISQAAYVAPASITVDPAEVNADAEEHDGTLALTYENLTISDMEDFDVQFYDAQGEETDVPDWIEVSVAGQDPAVGEGYVVSYYMLDNESEARTAYFKVFALGDEDYVYSNLVTINQNAPETPVGEEAWVLTNLADLTANDVFVIVGTDPDNGDIFVLPNNATTAAPAATSITVADGLLTEEPAEELQWHISGNATDGYTFYPNGDAESWLYCNNTNNGVRVGTNENNTFKMDEDGYMVNDATSRVLSIYVNSGTPQDWRCYSNYNNNPVAISFYKKVGEPLPPTASITMEFDNIEVTATGESDYVGINYENLEITVASDFGIQFYNANGEELNGEDEPDWMTAEVTTQPEEDGYFVYYIIEDNTGAERTAYFKVFAMNGDDFVYSNLVTVTQEEYVSPVVPESWVLTDFADLMEGDVFVIVGDNGDTYAMPNNNGTSAPSAVEITVENDALTQEPAANLQWNLSITDNGYIFYPNGDTENWLYCISNNNGLKVGNGDNNTFIIKDDYLYNTGRERYIGIYNSQDWRSYTSINNNIAGQTFSFYKKVVEPETYTLDITGYGDNEGGYYLIASPVYVNPETTGMTQGDYDLYWFDQNQAEEWRNYEAKPFNLVPGKGYLYAHKTDTILTFAGTPYSGDGTIKLVKNDDAVFSGWNLVGNPFSQTAYIDRDYYTMKEDGSEIVAADEEDGSVEPMHGIFVIADEDNDVITFDTVSGMSSNVEEKVVINVTNNRGIVDRAIVRFGEGRQLPKFQLKENSTKVYIPQGTGEYAVVRSANQGDMPVNFKASEEGTYTFSVNTGDLEVEYLHLIDNITGADVDLLRTPSYTFDANTTDFASRFRLVFSANGVDDNTESSKASFAFYNGSEWVISNTGAATLQVVDVMGRVLSTESINGNATANVNQVAGIYMLRLVNGDNVRVQKIVVK